MKANGIIVAAALGAAAPGCATITSTEIQSVSVTTVAADGQPVERASCSLRNDKGTWKIEAPGFVGVSRSAEDLLVECRKEGRPDGFLRAVSRAAAGMFGNIIFGGGIGAIIDHSKGTGYDYPTTLAVKMGESVVVDRRDEQSAAGQGATGVGAAIRDW